VQRESEVIMSTSHERLGRLERAVRRQRVALGALGGVVVLLCAGGQASRSWREGEERGAGAAAVQYAAGGDKLYRIHPGGHVEYIVVDFAEGTVDGIPGWASVHVDPTLSRDRMGNVVVLRK
jgi:hypothetical protein